MDPQDLSQLLKWHLEIDRYLEEAGRLLITCEAMRLAADFGTFGTCVYMDKLRSFYAATRRSVHLSFVGVMSSGECPFDYALQQDTMTLLVGLERYLT